MVPVGHGDPDSLLTSRALASGAPSQRSLPVSAPVRRRAGLALLGVVAVVLAGCRVTVTAGAQLDRDGSGRATLTLHLDEALLTELDRLELDPTAELTVVAEEVDDWQLERETVDDGLALTLARDVGSPEELAAAFAELAAGLSEDDPALLVDLDVAVVDGASTVTGEVALRPPAGPGTISDDPDVAATEAAAMAAAVTEHVDARFELTLPATPETHDADEVTGTTLRYDVAVGAPREVTASAPAPGTPPTEVLVTAAAAALLAVGALVLWRRRSGRA
ncbi:hypothetical protein FTX61_14015 [Nitriliruptoraceae bacterium ZYF776]|nr:hypothetical protein [Profundirhabdus halotolerans]